VKVKRIFGVPSSATLLGETVKVTVESSSVIVPVTVFGVLIVYPDPEDSVSPMVSFGSATVSAVGSIVILAVVEPGAKAIVPVVAV
jgi:hypothetical protein